MSKTRLPNKPAGKSKYALKCSRRKALAQKLGVPVAPFPVLNSIKIVNIDVVILPNTAELENWM